MKQPAVWVLATLLITLGVVGGLLVGWRALTQHSVENVFVTADGSVLVYKSYTMNYIKSRLEPHSLGVEGVQVSCQWPLMPHGDAPPEYIFVQLQPNDILLTYYDEQGDVVRQVGSAAGEAKSPQLLFPPPVSKDVARDAIRRALAFTREEVTRQGLPQPPSWTD